MPAERILISGAGVAGCTLAFWLAKFDFKVVVVERSKAEQKAGQGLEIEEPALEVVKQMGVLDKLKAKRTGEEGFDLFDQDGRLQAYFPAGGASPTGALELMRGDITDVLYKAADASPNVSFRFETTVHSISELEDTVSVVLGDRYGKNQTTEDFDLIVGADGVKSHTRRMVMGSDDALNCYKEVGAYVAFFSVPKEDQDWPNSRLCHFPGRRIVWTRPISKESKMTSVHLIHVTSKRIPDIHDANASGDRQQQKAAIAKLYGGLGWETPRIINQLMTAENFYSDTLSQVKLSKWSKGRFVLLGDAAWAPTPFTGEGNQLALIGGWVLAQELSRNRSTLAFEKYEARLRQYVESCQQIPLGGYMPYLLNPDTSLGVWLVRKALWLLSLGIRLSSWMFPSQSSGKQEHAYDLEFEQSQKKR